MPSASLSLGDIALLRLRNQGLIGRGLATAAEVVGWLGAVQSQDYAGAKWGVGQRMRKATDADVEQAFTAGDILRTHVLRPTWHFVLPRDIRWLLGLTAPRVIAAMAYYDRKLGLDAPSFARGHAALERALAGGKHLTRTELAAALEAAGLEASGQRLAHLLMRAELDALICSAPRRGKQFTYALLEERAAAAPQKTRDEALAELTRRYFTSHGPALAQDCAWWSGLTLGDVKRGLSLSAGALSKIVVDERDYWYAGELTLPRRTGPLVHLLPNYDEHLIAYKERSAAFDRERIPKLGSRELPLANHLIVLDGRIAGGWRREGTRPDAPLELSPIVRLSTVEKKALQAAQERLRAFLEPD